MFLSRNGGQSLDLAQVPLSGTPEDVEILAEGTLAVAFVLAEGSVITGDRTSQSIVEIVPGRVGPVTVAAGDGEVTTTWTAPTDDGGRPITSYLVEVVDDGDVIASRTVTGMAATIDGLPNGRPVRVRVRATNRRAEGLIRFSTQVVPAASGVVRLSGPDRYATGAAVSDAAFPDPVDVVYVATGTGFADALTGGPLAAVHDAPVVLTAPDALPTASAMALTRLDPQRVVVLGGTAAVDDAVLDDIEELVGVVPDRLAGTSRFDTARLIAQSFPDGQRDVFVAFGRNFPDALAGSALAASRRNPILLTERDALPDETRRAIRSLQPDTITVLGGPAVVSAAVLTELEELADDVVRLAGDDRFATARAIADEFDAPVTSVFVSTGRNFPDALTGAAAAARGGNPLLLTERDRVPTPISEALTDLSPIQIVILGGEVAVSRDVAMSMTSFLRQ